MQQMPYPRGNNSMASAYTSTRSSSSYRPRRALKTYGPPFLGIVACLWFLLWLFGGSSSSSSSSSSIGRAPPGTPEVVVVTTLDPKLSAKYKENIKENRRHYASRHGYATFFPNTTDYDLMPKTPQSWSTVPAMRHAMTVYPHTPWIWYLTSTALIMNAGQSLHEKLLHPRTLESLMITDKPVVPPDSVIKTFGNLRGERVDLVVSQDKEGLAGGSLMIRSGEWAKFFLDAWYDPLYRSYNFQRAEGHALEHIVQWHGTVLAKLALVPQRILNSYTREKGGDATEGLYQEGDFIANFHGCQRDATRDCEEEMRPLMSRWRELRDQERKRK
ncbi:glycosyltransferase family 34 [Lecanosticta acicola]|uniref:Glycosyltransferase family 34 n=1 Tax=Lecanosticta acicola TaxID=111012 RepID=A0AAI9EF83_9PEZI|nr:glycosyltransferase family 34 [Lecanosticta acicola]